MATSQPASGAAIPSAPVSQNVSTNWHSWAIGLLGFFFPLLVFTYFRLTQVLPVSIVHVRKLIADAQKLGEPYRDDAANAFWRQVGRWYQTPRREQSEAESSAQRLFIKCYLRNQTIGLKDNLINTTTKEFTALYWELTNLLTSPTRDGKHRGVLRLHLTAMLPEEFYNGPQIVYQETDSFIIPRILCHRWEEYEYFYPDAPTRQKSKPYSTRLGDWPGLKTQRYIVVRQGSNTAPHRLGVLSTSEELESERSLLIQDVVRPFAALRNECPGVISRLFRKAQLEEQPTEMLKEILSQVQEQDRFHYSPIVEEAQRPKEVGGAPHEKWLPLFKDFARKYHKQYSDALCWTINANNWSKIVGTAALESCFVSGTSPEIVLYKDLNLDRWVFGLQGRYRPFTRDIEVQFLRNSAAQRLANEIETAVRGNVRQLIDAKGQKLF